MFESKDSQDNVNVVCPKEGGATLCESNSHHRCGSDSYINMYLHLVIDCYFYEKKDRKERTITCFCSVLPH